MFIMFIMFKAQFAVKIGFLIIVYKKSIFLGLKSANYELTNEQFFDTVKVSMFFFFFIIRFDLMLG